jgi:NTE family protein
MSIPYFFQPVELVHHQTGVTSTIVDGGVLSNFPVWIFDVEDHDPLRPTFGFKLIGGKGLVGGSGAIKALGWPVQMGIDIFHTATEAWDTYWVSHATYVRTCTIPAGSVGTTEFTLGAEQRRALMDSGAQSARAFLDNWDPERYVNAHGRHLAGTAAARAAAA